MPIDSTTWATLNYTIMGATEKECAETLEHELEHKRRNQFALRIFCRFNRLRTVRERHEIVKRLNDGTSND
jgi:hypothetical protein